MMAAVVGVMSFSLMGCGSTNTVDDGSAVEEETVVDDSADEDAEEDADAVADEDADAAADEDADVEADEDADAADAE